MQLNGIPTTRFEIMLQASAFASRQKGEPVVLTDGWYSLFKARHPQLTKRQEQTISRTQNECTIDLLHVLFNTLIKLIIEMNFDASRIETVFETSFLTCRQSATVVTLRGSSNIWTQSIGTNFICQSLSAGERLDTSPPSLHSSRCDSGTLPDGRETP